jgi:hypothetical protein
VINIIGMLGIDHICMYSHIVVTLDFVDMWDQMLTM